MEKVSEKIRAARNAKGVTIEELSQKTLISVSVIKDIENGAFDKYQGDEQYVKMYLKKIAKQLDIDETIADEYIALTQELKLEDLKKHEQEAKLQNDKKGNTAIVNKMSGTLKNIQTSKPQKQASKRVYEDHYILRYVKYALALLLVAAILFVIWYSLISTKSDDPTTFNNDKATVEGNVDNKEEQDQKKQEEEQRKQEEEEQKRLQEQANMVEYTKNDRLNYNFKLGEGQTTFKLKIEFVGRTYAKMEVNGSEYDGFKSGIYNRGNTAESMDVEPEVVELEFNVADFQNLELDLGYNRGHRFYINDQQIPIEESEYNNGNATLKLTLVQ